MLVVKRPLNDTTKRRVAIYARVSTTDKGQDPENQLRQLRPYPAIMSALFATDSQGVVVRKVFDTKIVPRRQRDFVLSAIV